MLILTSHSPKQVLGRLLLVAICLGSSHALAEGMTSSGAAAQAPTRGTKKDPKKKNTLAQSVDAGAPAAQPPAPAEVPSTPTSVPLPAVPGPAAAPGPEGSTGLANLPPAPPAPPAETFIALPPMPPGARHVRAKSLKMTVGVPPTTGDLGSEADSVDSTTSLAEGGRTARISDNWSFVLKGYLRAPMRIGYGPKDGTAAGAASPDYEFHSPVRMVGLSSSNWAYINIAPNSTSSLRATIQNSRVAATMILSMNTFSDVGYSDLDSTGGLGQGYVTLKFPDAFAERGGLSFSLGAFATRYGYAGPNQVNAGYYGTYLFGRTRLVGETLTADIDLNDRVELLFEHGFGAEIDILLKQDNAPKQMFIPGAPNQRLGSNFVHHAHVALWIDQWLKVAAHYITSWTPNDNAQNASFGVIGEGRLSSTGAEVHLDHPRFGHGYLGYSHVWGENLLVLNDALNVIHGGRGYDFKLQYFGNKLRLYDQNSTFYPNDSGRVDTILFQHKLFSNGLFDHPLKGIGVSLAVFGMYSHVYSPASRRPFDSGKVTQNGVPVMLPAYNTIRDNKLKFGTDVLFSAMRNVSVGFRFDRVQPTSMDTGQSYSAYTPYLWITPDWNSTRKMIVSYTRFALGRDSFPDSPYSGATYAYADPNLFVISVLMSL